MTEVLGALPNPDLKVFVVWMPILANDNRDAAYRNAAAFDDPRMVHMWDGVANEGMIWNRKLGLPTGQLAWNCYIVIPRGATWDGDQPPTPVYWSHSLTLDIGVKYDAAALRQAVRAALEKSGAAKGAKPAKGAEPARTPAPKASAGGAAGEGKGK